MKLFLALVARLEPSLDKPAIDKEMIKLSGEGIRESLAGLTLEPASSLRGALLCRRLREVSSVLRDTWNDSGPRLPKPAAAALPLQLSTLMCQWKRGDSRIAATMQATLGA